MTYTPTEHANIDATRRIVEDGNRQDWDAVYSLVADDCLCYVGSIVLRGHAEMRAYDAQFFPLFTSMERKILDISADDDTVVFRWRTEAVVAASGKPIVFEGCSWSRMTDGKAVESWIYTNAPERTAQ